MLNLSAPDLTQHPPRSPRVKLGGFVHLPRLLDKTRAMVAGKNGAYTYAAMMDGFFFEFTGIKPDAFMKAVATGKSDSEMLAWVMENQSPRRTPSEIAQWSSWLERHGPGSPDRHSFFAQKITANGPTREDIQTFFDHLDLDDYVGFGGKG